VIAGVQGILLQASLLTTGGSLLRDILLSFLPLVLSG